MTLGEWVGLSPKALLSREPKGQRAREGPWGFIASTHLQNPSHGPPLLSPPPPTILDSENSRDL